MDVLKTANFATLFAVTFVVAATFQFSLSVIALIFAWAFPSFFTMNGRPATGGAEASAIIAFMLVCFLLMNAMISSAGAAIWLAVRGRLLKKR
jgi:riboflavin transporter FmnP